ncbi:extracellular solute-binding protein, partial [Clostridium sp.]|uniref:extracellular solute-binding protein n=1 Tax=Clostridium sp. TaxID=1506 RepID=UPI003FD6EFCA
MNRKKIFSMLLSATLVISLLSGCGAKKVATTDNGAGKAQKEFSLFYNMDTKPVDISSTAVGKKVTEITGTKFKTSYLVGTDSKTKSGVMIASGEYPDLISIDAGDVDSFINAGAVIPLEDLIAKYGTNIKKIYGADLKKIKNPKDGHTYSLPPFRNGPTPLYPASGFYLAKDVLKQAGYPKILNIDQYFKIIDDYMAKNPTFNGKPNIGFTTNAVSGNYLIANVGSYLAGYPNTGACYIDDKNVAHNFGLSDFTHNYLKKLNEEWNKNIVDKKLFIDNNDAFKAKVAAGSVVGMYMERWEIGDPINSLEQQKLFDKVPFAIPVLNDGVKKDAYSGLTSIGTGGGIYITKSCKDPVAAFKLLDQIASDKIQKLQNWGI